MEAAIEQGSDADEVIGRFARHVTAQRIDQEAFCSSMHPYLTMDELLVAFRQVAFDCTSDEVRLIFADQQALRANYLPMERFYDRVAAHPNCQRWQVASDQTPKGILKLVQLKEAG